MALRPVNPSPCVPGLPNFGSGFGNAWTGNNGIGGSDYRGQDGDTGAGGAAGANGLAGGLGANGLSPPVAAALNQMAEVIRQLTNTVRTLSQASSTNFRELQALVDAFEESQSGGLCVLRETLYQGGTALAQKAKWGNPGFFGDGDTFEVVDYFLNDGESVESGTKINIIPYQGIKAVVGMYCSVADPVI
jgi:hypothetical protein